MRTKITTYQWLQNALAELDDDGKLVYNITPHTISRIWKGTHWIEP